MPRGAAEKTSECSEEVFPEHVPGICTQNLQNIIKTQQFKKLKSIKLTLMNKCPKSKDTMKYFSTTLVTRKKESFYIYLNS